VVVKKGSIVYWLHRELLLVDDENRRIMHVMTDGRTALETSDRSAAGFLTG
jgi:hypothetical protein